MMVSVVNGKPKSFWVNVVSWVGAFLFAAPLVLACWLYLANSRFRSWLDGMGKK